MNIIVNKATSKRIRTSKDLSDFYAYCEQGVEWYAIHYSFAESEQERIDSLVNGINYKVGVFDKENVKRILGVNEL